MWLLSRPGGSEPLLEALLSTKVRVWTEEKERRKEENRRRKHEKKTRKENRKEKEEKQKPSDACEVCPFCRLFRKTTTVFNDRR